MVLPRSFLLLSCYPLVTGFPFTSESSLGRRKHVTFMIHTASTTEARTPFRIFQDHNVERIGKSDRLGINKLSENVQAASVLQPIISWAELQRLTSTQNSTFGERSEFAQSFASSGSFLLLELEEPQAAIVDNMWESMQEFFDQVEEKDLRHQTIAREGDTHENLGYKFVQTYNTLGDVVLPTIIQDTLGHSPTTQRCASDSFLSFADIAMAVAIAVSAGALNEEPDVMRSVVNGLVHSSSTRFASANHRLSRYVLTDSETDLLKESLRAHTDWTLTTAIPLSATPGLHLWKPNSEQWVAPESLVHDLSLPRSRYLVVMAGKWMELLTNQAVLACIHRVVSRTSQHARLSAPFFLRPKEVVFESLSNEFNNPDDTSEIMSTQQATGAIHSMFQGFIDMNKGAEYP